MYDLIRWGQDALVVKAILQGELNQGIVEHIIKQKGNRECLYNKNPKKMWEITGIIPFVYFAPEHILILKGDASYRRKAVDFILTQIYPYYKYLIRTYRRIVLERNAALKRIRNNLSSIKILEEWDKSLINIGIKICEKRKFIIDALNEKLIHISPSFFNMQGQVNIEYKTIGAESLEQFKESLEKIRAEEVKYGITLVGPHRDELVFKYNNIDLKKFGSQGQQRACILSLKCASAQILEEQTKELPLIVFDDVFSELDKNRKQALVNILDKKNQIFLSQTVFEQEAFFNNKEKSIFRIKEGKVWTKD